MGLQIGDVVRWTKADPTDPQSNITIIEIRKFSGETEQRALCEWVDPGSPYTSNMGLSEPHPVVSRKQDWFLLSELVKVG